MRFPKFPNLTPLGDDGLHAPPCDDAGGDSKAKADNPPQALKNMRMTLCIANSLARAFKDGKPDCEACITPNACQELVDKVKQHINDIHNKQG